jgi:hypothetical protein
LDKQASGQAKKAISEWIQPKEYDKAAVGDAILELFDRIYTRPLLGWRAAMRSIILTLIISAVFLYESSEWLVFLPLGMLAGMVSINAISDYISLFIVRRLLVVGRSKPFRAALLGPALGMVIVAILIVLYPTAIVIYITKGYLSFIEIGFIILPPLMFVGYIFLAIGALVVHLWLPLLALCIGTLKVINYLRIAIGWTQWFIKQGRQHPLDAVG